MEKTKLMPLVARAHTMWEEGHSHYICDCLTASEEIESPSAYRNGYPLMRPLLDLVSSSIGNKSTVYEFLFDVQWDYQATEEQCNEAITFRHALWEKLFVLAELLDNGQ